MNDSTNVLSIDRVADDRPPIIILGCPRSGTLLTSRILGGYPGNFLITEHSLKNKRRYCPEDRSGIVDDDIWCEHFEFASCVLDGKRHSIDVPLYDADAVQRVRQAYLNHARTLRLVIKNPGHLLRINLLQEMFPNAQYVFCVRHPWHTLQSMTIKQNASFLLRTADFDSLPDDLLLKAAHSWRAACDAYKQYHNENWVLCRYEELVSKPDRTIKTLFDSLGFTDPDYYSHAITLPRKSQKNYFFIKNQFRKNRYRDKILGQLEPGVRQFGYSIDVESLQSDAWQHFKKVLMKKLGRK